MELDREAGPLRAIISAVELALIFAKAKGDIVAVTSPLVLDEQTLLRLHHHQITEDDGLALRLEDKISVLDVRTAENIQLLNVVEGGDSADTGTTGDDVFETQVPVRITGQDLSLKLPARELRDGNEIPVPATDGIKCLRKSLEPQVLKPQLFDSFHDVPPFVLPNGRFQNL